MTGEVHETRMIERDILRKVEEAFAAIAPNLRHVIDIYMFDAFVTIVHDADSPIDAMLPFHLARHMRDGRDHDPTRPGDWHVSTGEARREIAHGVFKPMGTVISLLSSRNAPVDYREPNA